MELPEAICSPSHRARSSTVEENKGNTQGEEEQREREGGSERGSEGEKLGGMGGWGCTLTILFEIQSSLSVKPKSPPGLPNVVSQ